MKRLFSKETDRSLQVLSHLAIQQPDDYQTTDELAEACQSSTGALSKTIRRLASLGYIETKKGPGGGVRLRTDPKALRLDEILAKLRELEPQGRRSTACCKPPGLEQCPLQLLVDQFRGTVLSNYTLHDLVIKDEEL